MCTLPCCADARVVLVVVVLAWSRAVWAELRVNGEAELVKSLERAWAFFGGAPRTWLFETDTVHVLEVLEHARRRGAIAMPSVREGTRWGEWALRRMSRRLRRPLLARDLEHAQRRVRDFVQEMLQRRRPDHHDRRVCELLQDERAHLRAEVRG